MHVSFYFLDWKSCSTKPNNVPKNYKGATNSWIPGSAEAMTSYILWFPKQSPIVSDTEAHPSALARCQFFQNHQKIAWITFLFLVIWFCDHSFLWARGFQFFYGSRRNGGCRGYECRVFVFWWTLGHFWYLQGDCWRKMKAMCLIFSFRWKP